MACAIRQPTSEPPEPTLAVRPMNRNERDADRLPVGSAHTTLDAVGAGPPDPAVLDPVLELLARLAGSTLVPMMGRVSIHSRFMIVDLLTTHMASSNSTESLLEDATSTAGSRATDAFKLLSNEKRLAILVALWEAYDPDAETSAVSFSSLRERVGIRHGEQFYYHLEKLLDHFVRKTDDGYELRRAGRQVVQSVISGTGIEERALEPVEIDATCEFCDGATVITYENNYVWQVCTECRGKSDPDDGHPSGYLRGLTFDPAGLTGRTAAEVFEASWIKSYGRMLMRFEGICPECSGPVEWSLDGCEDHDATAEEVCPNCGRIDPVFSREICTVCKSWAEGSPGFKLLVHPAVVAFYYDHGVEVGFTGNTGYTTLLRMIDIVENLEQEVVATSPPRVRATFSHGGDDLHLLLDEELNVLEVTESF